MRKNCSSDREKLLNFEAEGREFAKFLRSLEQLFLTVGQNNFGNKIPFLNEKILATLFIMDNIEFRLQCAGERKKITFMQLWGPV